MTRPGRVQAGQRLGFALVAAHAGVIGARRREIGVDAPRTQVGREAAQTAERADHEQDCGDEPSGHGPKLNQSPATECPGVSRSQVNGAEGVYMGTMLLSRWVSPLALLLALTGAALGLGCDDDEIGTPCESEKDCSEALICDVHGDKGTCQREHGH